MNEWPDSSDSSEWQEAVGWPAAAVGCLLLGHWWEVPGRRQACKYRYMAGRSGAGRKFNTRPGMMPMEFMPIRKRPTYAGPAAAADWVQPLARVALLTAEKL